MWEENMEGWSSQFQWPVWGPDLVKFGLGLMSVTPHTDASTRVCEVLLKVSEPSEG